MGDADQEQARRLIRAALAETGVTPSRLAKIAGVAHSTITRFLNNPDVKHAPSTRTMNKITMAATRIRLMRSDPVRAKPARKKRQPRIKLAKPMPAKKGQR